MTVAFEKSVSKRSALMNVALAGGALGLRRSSSTARPCPGCTRCRRGGAALGGGDHGAPIARPEVHDDVLRRHLGHVEHLVDERLRRRHPDDVLARLSDLGFIGLLLCGFLRCRRLRVRADGQQADPKGQPGPPDHTWCIHERAPDKANVGIKTTTRRGRTVRVAPAARRPFRIIHCAARPRLPGRIGRYNRGLSTVEQGDRRCSPLGRRNWSALAVVSTTAAGCSARAATSAPSSSREPLRLAITPSAAHKGDAHRPAHFLRGRRARGVVGRPPQSARPSAETLLHLEIVRARGARRRLAHPLGLEHDAFRSCTRGAAASPSRATRCSRGSTASRRTSTASGSRSSTNDQDMPRLAAWSARRSTSIPPRTRSCSGATGSTPGAGRSAGRRAARRDPRVPVRERSAARRLASWRLREAFPRRAPHDSATRREVSRVPRRRTASTTSARTPRHRRRAPTRRPTRCSRPTRARSTS